MTQVAASTLALITLGMTFVGVAVGLLTSNMPFVFLMVALPTAAFFVFGIFIPSESPTMPARGRSSVVLPVIALVVSCLGISVIGIALGHVSRYLIRASGGDGEMIGLAALVVGYSTLAVEASVVLWLVTFAFQIAGA
jgi:hypothetical protein